MTRTLGSHVARDLAKRGIVILRPGQPGFPRYACNGDDLAVRPLFARGDVSLLTRPKVALLVSRREKAEKAGGDWLEAAMVLCEHLARAGSVVVCGAEMAHYEAIRHKMAKIHAAHITVTDGSLPEPVGPNGAGPSLHLSLWEGDCGESAAKERMRLRDHLVALLADRVIVVSARAEGNMFQVAQRAMEHGKPVAACVFPAAQKGNDILLGLGAKPLTPGYSGVSLRHFMGEACEVGRTDAEKRQKALGQFFTPRRVAEFMWRVAASFRKALGLSAGTLKAIDPAVGEGVFLESADISGFTFQELVGIDMDPALVQGWQSRLKADARVGVHLGDGLVDQPWLGIARESFDIAIGNPPFGGEGLALLARVEEDFRQGQGDLFGPATRPPDAREVDRLHARRLAAELINHYETWRPAEAVRLTRTEDEDPKQEGYAGAQQQMWREDELPQAARARAGVNRRDEEEAREYRLLRYHGGPHSAATRRALDLLSRFPIEILFVERFLQLLKPGGLLAAIVPDGIVANAQTRYLRSWLREKADLLGVVTLPRGIFGGVAAHVATSILFLLKKGGPVRKAPRSVIMASPGTMDRESLADYLTRIEGGIETWRPEAQPED